MSHDISKFKNKDFFGTNDIHFGVVARNKITECIYAEVVQVNEEFNNLGFYRWQTICFVPDLSKNNEWILYKSIALSVTVQHIPLEPLFTIKLDDNGNKQFIYHR